MATQTKPDYDAGSFRVLKDLEPVRSRPGMYTRTDSPSHIIQEVIDNAADEALGGYASRIDVTMQDDGSVSVSDNGRGIPVDLHPEEKVPAVTLAFTRLHAGGKFDKTTGGAYAFSGGLHGVGVAVTTALSLLVRVVSRRRGHLYEVEYADGGRSIGSVRKVRPIEASDTGTTVHVTPDAKYFDTAKVPRAEMERLLQSKAVLLPGVTFTLTIDGQTRTWSYAGGLAEYLEELAGGAEPVAPIYVGEQFQQPLLEGENAAESSFAPGEGASYAFGWYPESGPASQSYVNLIPTKDGGTHVSGLKAGIFEAVKRFIEHHSNSPSGSDASSLKLPRGVKLQQEDVCARMAFVLSARCLDPSFQGQTKERLNTRGAVKLIHEMVKDPFEVWLNNNVDAGKAIAALSIRQALSRQKDGKPVEKRKSSGVTLLPGKLADCESHDDSELFLVEGDSAGGSAKEARSRTNQAILPLRGKVLNTFEVERHRLFANSEIHDISVATGVDPHDASDDPAVVLANLRYTRLMIMTDADVDGAHIQTLLLTHLYAHLPLLLIHGHVWIVQSPLYRIDVASGGNGRPARRIYALDDEEHRNTLDALQREGVRESRIEIGRFKGLGEMQSDQLRETSMDPATRRVHAVKYDIALAADIKQTFTHLMSTSQAAWRRDWLAREGATVDADV
ncbi:DNA topoisomerase IV subunit B [Variovorax sp. LT1P1]|uniref:DNA topoisomerase IV subunit B n=1 Tax=Variovorax sp. LT1P1 TaxID=3443730 RepID=UPI003F46ED99